MTPTDFKFIPPEDDIKGISNKKYLLKVVSAISFANYLSKYKEVTPENLDRYFRRKIRLYKRKIERSLLDHSAKYRKEVIEHMIKNESLEFISFIKTSEFEISSEVAKIGSEKNTMKIPITDRANFDAAEKKWFKIGLRYFTLKYVVRGKGIANEKKVAEEKAKQQELLKESNVMKLISESENKADAAFKQVKKYKAIIEKVKIAQRAKEAKGAHDMKAMLENAKASNRKDAKSIAELRKIMTKISALENEKDEKKVKLVVELKKETLNSLYLWKYGHDKLDLLTSWLVDQGYIDNAINFKLVFSNSFSDADKVEWLKAPKYALIYLAFRLGMSDTNQWIVDHFLFKGKETTKSELQKLRCKYHEVYVGSKPKGGAHTAIQSIYQQVLKIKS